MRHQTKRAMVIDRIFHSEEIIITSNRLETYFYPEHEIYPRNYQSLYGKVF